MIPEIIKVKVKEPQLIDGKLIENVIEKEFQVSHLTQEVQDYFVRYLKGQYLDLIKKNKELLGSDYNEMLLKYFFEIEQGIYDWGFERSWEFLNI